MSPRAPPVRAQARHGPGRCRGQRRAARRRPSGRRQGRDRQCRRPVRPGQRDRRHHRRGLRQGRQGRRHLRGGVLDDGDRARVHRGHAVRQGLYLPYFVTDADRMEAVLEDAYILIHQSKISAIAELLPVLEKVVQSGKPLLIVAEDVDGEALSTLVVNKIRGTFNAVAVKAPGFGDRRKAMPRTSPSLTGGQVVAEEVGLKLDQVGLEVLAPPVGSSSPRTPRRSSTAPARPPTSTPGSRRSSRRSTAPTRTGTARSFQERLAARRRGLRHQGRRPHRGGAEGEEAPHRGRHLGDPRGHRGGHRRRWWICPGPRQRRDRRPQPRR